MIPDMILDSTPLFSMADHIQTRWASPENPQALRGGGGKTKAGRKGLACLPLAAGAQLVLAEISGTSGMIRRIWSTISERTPVALRGLRIDIYWDGAATPAVSAPFGDFFGQGLGRCQKFESALLSNPEGRSFNCCVPMPFKSGFKIVVTNELDVNIRMIFYDIDFTVGDKFDETTLYFHTHWRRENPTTMRKDYELLPKVSGRGRFLGVNVGVIANTEIYFKSWWGEGEVKVYLNGDGEYPTLCGTGTEDYIGTAWGQGQYWNLYQGCPVADDERQQFTFYRWHLPDPIYFHREIRVTIHQIGCWNPDNLKMMHAVGRKLIVNDGPEETLVNMEAAIAANGYGLFERKDDWSSCSYFYLERAENGLPLLAPVAERTKGLIGSDGKVTTLA